MPAQSWIGTCRLTDWIVLGLMVGTGLAPASYGVTLYVVKNNAGAAEPYDTTNNAAPDIQTAINYASVGATVLVAAATYDLGGITNWPVPTTYTCGLLTNRVVITKAITVRSANNDPTNTIIKGAWASDGQTNGVDAVRCVYMVSGSSLIGFTLTNGATYTTNGAASRLPDINAGGVYAQSSSAIISNCILVNNAADGESFNSASGGGAAAGGTFFNCIFRNNSCDYRGGAVDSATLYNCTLVGNSAILGGGAAHRGTLYGCLLQSNSTSLASGLGGATLGWSDTIPCRVYDSMLIANTAYQGGGAATACILSNCTVAFNVSQNNGGGARICTLINCLVISNRSVTGIGGGLAHCILTNSTVAYNSTAGAGLGSGTFGGSLYNSIFYGNRGTAVYCQNGDIVSSCTFVGNGGLGMYHEGGGGATVLNSILYDNALGNWTNVGSSSITFTNSCTTPAKAGWAASNITNDPLFVVNGSGYGTNLVPGNYRLQANSPCVNRGTNQTWMTRTLDLDGKTRIRYGTVDMGAYEVIYDGTIYKVH